MKVIIDAGWGHLQVPVITRKEAKRIEGLAHRYNEKIGRYVYSICWDRTGNFYAVRP